MSEPMCVTFCLSHLVSRNSLGSIERAYRQPWNKQREFVPCRVPGNKYASCGAIKPSQSLNRVKNDCLLLTHSTRFATTEYPVIQRLLKLKSCFFIVTSDCATLTTAST